MFTGQKHLLKRYDLTALTAIITIILMTVIMAGCAKNQASKEDQQLVVAVSSDVGIDKLDAGGYNGLIQAYTMIYDPLVDYGERGKIIPSLAESWEISSDGKTYTFHLRKGVKFSDGTPFDADVAKFSIERWCKDPANSSLSVSKAMQAIDVVDPYTLKLTFSKKYYPFLTELTYPRPVRIISPTAVEPKGDIKGKFIKPIGTGAWMVESYTKDQQAVLVRNPNYWGVKPKLAKIVLKVIPDPQSRAMALQSGEVDLAGSEIGAVPTQSITDIRKEGKLQIYTQPGTMSYLLIFNYNNDLLKDLNVRKAINMAIDKQSMVDNLLGGIGRPARGLFQPTVPYVTASNNKGYAYDQAAAKELLKDSGYADSNGDGILEKNGKPLEFSLVLQNAQYPEWKPMCEYIQGQLKGVGIKLDLQMLDQNAYYDVLWRNRKFDLIIYRTYTDSWNPHGFLFSLFHTAGQGSGTPSVAWSDPALDNAIDEVLGTMDENERQVQYDHIFDMMYQQAMCAPLYYTDEVFVASTKVKGFAWGFSSYSPVKWEDLTISQ